MRVLIQLRDRDIDFETPAARFELSSQSKALAGALSAVDLDPDYAAAFEVIRPGYENVGATASKRSWAEMSNEPTQTFALVRARIPDNEAAANDTIGSLLSNSEVVGIFSDPAITTWAICAGDPAHGTADDVASLLGSADLVAGGLDGSGVRMAIVDSGINLAHLRSRGRRNAVDAANSWSPQPITAAGGMHPVGHGTMCAFDAGILAPESVLLDHSVLLSTAPGATMMEGLLSDALLSYAEMLRGIRLEAPSDRRLVISNSWGMASPQWDFPVGHVGNYSHNSNHPFSIVVSAIVNSGADVLFAAGNCGLDCPDTKCNFGGGAVICGANSYPNVISVAGIDTGGARVGYSSQGPGTLSSRKPDLSGYTHFFGSGVYPVDSGTSAACPVIAGLVAAVRTRYSGGELSPLDLKTLLCRSTFDPGTTGFDFDTGWGVPNIGRLLAMLP